MHMGLSVHFKVCCIHEAVQTIRESDNMEGGCLDQYPFTLIHISLVAYQNFVHIIRGMLLDVAYPIPYVCVLENKLKCQYNKENYCKVIYTKALKNVLKDSTVER